MNLSGILTYKVIEADQLLAIVHADAHIAQRGGIELIIGTLPVCCEYLARYTNERASGLTPDDAHRVALKGAHVVGSGGLSAVNGAIQR